MTNRTYFASRKGKVKPISPGLCSLRCFAKYNFNLAPKIVNTFRSGAISRVRIVYEISNWHQCVASFRWRPPKYCSILANSHYKQRAAPIFPFQSRTKLFAWIYTINNYYACIWRDSDKSDIAASCPSLVKYTIRIYGRCGRTVPYSQGALH